MDRWRPSAWVTGAVATYSRAVLIRRKDEAAWRSPAVTNYTDEAALEGLLAESPQELLGASEPVAAVRQLRVPEVGSVDLVAVSLSGKITLVEYKLRANPEIRQHVIGQVFAYAAGLWKLTYDEFDRRFTAQAGGSLAATVAMAANLDDDWDQDVFRQLVGANLATGLNGPR